MTQSNSFISHHLLLCIHYGYHRCSKIRATLHLSIRNSAPAFCSSHLQVLTCKSLLSYSFIQLLIVLSRATCKLSQVLHRGSIPFNLTTSKCMISHSITFPEWKMNQKEVQITCKEICCQISYLLGSMTWQSSHEVPVLWGVPTLQTFASLEIKHAQDA